MSWNSSGIHLPFQASEDIGEAIAVKATTTENQVAITDAATDEIVGFTTQKAVSGQSIDVQTNGVVKATAGGTVAVGDEVAVTSSGTVTTPSANGTYKIVGIALTAGASGTFISLLMRRYDKTISS